MNTLACVTTSKGTAAISSIRLWGESACDIIGKIFRSVGRKKLGFQTGDILIGDIYDGDRLIDHVVVGCYEEGSFAINCHGNPLIVEMVMKVLEDNGAELISVEQFLAKCFVAASGMNAIEIEAKLTQIKAVTLEGVRVVAAQAKSGLAEILKGWQENIDSLKIEDVTSRCSQILADSKVAGLVINGCKAVIAGPPNSGKSTLLNCLAGRQKAIVAEIAGTTRDWVSATCRVGPLLVELVDTAGVDENLPTEDSVDKESQKRTAELLEDCDLVLLVLDGSKPLEKWGVQTDKKTIVVFNKSDLGGELTEENLDFDFAASVRMSAKTGDGLDGLIEKIPQVLLGQADMTGAVCFTDRQKALLQRLSTAKTKSDVKSIISELLNGQVCV